MHARHARLFATTVVALALLAAACSSDEDGTTTAPQPPAGNVTTTSTTGTDGTAPAHFGGHRSETYEVSAHWLCRPELTDDPCSGDLDTTIVEADGTTTIESFAVDPDAPIDCFYVYPTISSDATPNSDLEAGNEEIQVVRNQTARLGEVCRVYAPVYRQVTLGALMGAIGGTASEDDDAEAPDRELAYTDVLDAFKHYIDNDSDGRGFVLIGHSQGSGVLNRLIAEEIDADDELRSRLVAAYLLGSSVAVPEGADVGGDFQNVAACRSEEQIGCVVSYASFRTGDAPAAGALFGRPRSGDGVALCVNPAAPGGGSAEMSVYFLSGASVGFADPERNEEITTPFVAMPGLVSAECVERDGVNYLEVSVQGDPADPRADDIGGDFLPGWGLHLVDVNLAMGDIVALVRSQSVAYLAER